MATLDTSGSQPVPRRGPGRPAADAGEGGREALLRAARDLMAEKGLPRVTLREVAERAGVQPALVNYHFGSKKGLLRAVVAQVAGRMLERLREGLGVEGGPEEQLRALVRAVVGSLAEEPYAPRLVAEQVLFGEDEVIDDFARRFARPNLDLLQGVLEAGRASGEMRALEPMFVTPSILGSCLFFFLAEPMLRRLFDVEAITPELAERFAEHTAELLLRGVGQAKEKEIAP